MAIDPRIPLMVNPLQMEPRENALARIMALRGAQDQQQMRQMQMQQIREAMAEQMRHRAAAEQQRATVDNYLGSLNSNAGPARPFNPIEAMQITRDPQLAAQLASMFAAPKKPAPIAVEPGKTLVDPETFKPVYEAADRPEKQDPNKPFMLVNGQVVPNPAYQQYAERVARAGASSGGTVTLQGAIPVQNPDGTITYMQAANKPGAAAQPVINPATGKPAVRPNEAGHKPMTEAQAKATAFKSQMESAEKELSTTPIDPTKLASQVDVIMANGPANLIASPAAQRARQSQEQWAEAYLRFKTGAASTEDEVRRNVRTFFPQPGDSKAVIDQKARMRKQAAADVGYAATGQHQAPKASDAADIDSLVNKYRSK